MKKRFDTFKLQIVLLLIGFFIVDSILIFFAITPLALLYVAFARPPWFKNVVDRIYGQCETPNPAQDDYSE